MSDLSEKSWWGLAGAAVLGGVPALWRWFTGSSRDERTRLLAELTAAQKTIESLGTKLDREREEAAERERTEQKRREAAELKLIEALTWIRARDPAAQWEELPSKVQSVMDVTKDPFPELKGWDPAARTPTK